MRISCVIFTKDCDDWRLKNCLACNLRQTRLPDEILIIDFGSSEEYRRKYKEITKGCPNSSIMKFIEIDDDTELFHPARMANKAIQETTADYIVFTDADVLPSNNAYKEVEIAFNENPKQTVMCARLDLPKETNNEKINFVKLFDPLWQQNGGIADHRAPGSFQGFPVSWLKEVGGYDEHFIGWGYYDCDIYNRALDAGLPETWLETKGVRLMHIHHEFRPYRNDKKAIAKNEQIYYEKRARPKVKNEQNESNIH